VLRHNALKIVLARQLERPLAVAVDMVAVKEAVASLRHDRPEPHLPLNQRQIPQVFAIQPKQIEGVEPWFTTPERQIFELSLAMAVEADDFAVQNRRPGSELRLGLSVITRRSFLPLCRVLEKKPKEKSQ
jgi:hypothetical protein